jgi:serine/threonine-protein kinase HipA
MFAETLGLYKKQIENVEKRFHEMWPKAVDFIDRSFLSDDMKQAYKYLIAERADRINF